MEFLQEPTFTVFLALILSLLVAKIVSFAVSNSTSDGHTTVSSVGEGAVAKEVTLERELVVRSRKGQKRVKFVDDVVIRRIDRYEGSENPVLLDDAGEVGDVFVEEKSVSEKSGDRVYQFGDDGLGENYVEECSDLREIDDADAQVEGCEKTKMLIEKEVVSENVETLVTSGVKSEEGLEGDDMVIDEREGNGEREEVVTGDVIEEGKVRDESVYDEDDDWEGIERSELEKVFAEAVNYVEYGGKGKGDDQLAKLGSDAQMQLYGLHKVAVEGPCREPQPMALMVSARGKWNAWQRLGSMSQEAAMEQYIEVLSESIPEWMHGYSADDDIPRKIESKDKISVAEHERLMLYRRGKLLLSALPQLLLVAKPSWVETFCWCQVKERGVPKRIVFILLNAANCYYSGFVFDDVHVTVKLHLCSMYKRFHTFIFTLVSHVDIHECYVNIIAIENKDGNVSKVRPHRLSDSYVCRCSLLILCSIVFIKRNRCCIIVVTAFPSYVFCVDEM